MIERTFANLLNISYRRNWKELLLAVFVNISQYMGGILSYLILAIPIFTHVYAGLTPAELAQLISNYSFKSQYLIYYFTRLYDTLSEISVIAGNCKRVGELSDRMRLLGVNGFGSPSSSRSSESQFKRNTNSVEPISSTVSVSVLSNSEERFLTFSRVTIRVPNSDRVLIDNLNFEFRKGKPN